MYVTGKRDCSGVAYVFAFVGGRAKIISLDKRIFQYVPVP